MDFEPAKPLLSNIKKVNADAFAMQIEEILKIYKTTCL